MRTPRILFAAALAVAAAGATGCVVSSDDGDIDDATLTIINDSDYWLEEIYLSPVGARTWGPDLIDALAPGEELLIDNVRCDVYDALVVDDTGVECELRNLDLCANDDVWVIDNFTLDVCAFNP